MWYLTDEEVQSMEREGADDIGTDESRSPDTLCHDIYHNLTTTNTE